MNADAIPISAFTYILKEYRLAGETNLSKIVFDRL